MAKEENFEDIIIETLEDENPALAKELKNRLSALRKPRRKIFGKLKNVTPKEITIEIERFLEEKWLTQDDTVDYECVIEENPAERFGGN
jgi:hypothetical protein